nr:FAD-linked oxidase C-terminal domain-containing protein [Kineococcus vitellinus]
MAAVGSAPASVARVLRVLLDDPAGAAQLTVTDLARRTGTSEATVVRTARSLGFPGYPRLRLALAASAAAGAPAALLTGTLDDGSDLATVVATLAAVEAEAVAATARTLDVAALAAAADAVAGARVVDCYGIGASGLLAAEFDHKAARVGLLTRLRTEAHAALVSSALLGAGDVALVVSHSGRTRAVVAAARRAAANGARVVALTSAPASPLAAAADHVLVATGRETAYRAGATASRASSLLVLDCLHVAVAQPLLITDEAARAAVATDRSGHRPASLPDGVVRARDVDDVVQTMRWATATRTPVVARGAGTGLAASSSASAGQVVLDLSGMDRVLQLRPEDQVAVVEPGVLTADLDAAAGEHGLFYAPDPASSSISTVGGNIATNAGGLRCAKYGVTREAVLGLDLVLADGRRLRTGRQTVKGVAGYDLTGLVVGSEGTLAVVVGATLRLRPRPQAVATLAACFGDVVQAAAAAADITAARLQPSVLELVDAVTLEAVDALRGSSLRSRGEAVLVVQCDGRGAQEEIEAVGRVVAARATSWSATSDPAEAEELLAARRAALPALERLGDVFIEDVAVPRSQLAAAVAGIAEVSRRTGVRIATVAHAGDGNLHPIVVVERGASVTEGPPWEASCAVFELALRLGGTLTGEHGVGLLKRTWLREEVGEDSLALQLGIKAVFDPLGILNPGKAL